MKKWPLLILFIAFIQLSAFADMGNCLIYQAKFYLKDGSVFKASFEVISEDNTAYLDENGKNPYTSDEGIMKLIELLISYDYLRNDPLAIQLNQDLSNKIMVYKNLDELELVKMGEKYKTNTYNTIFGFVQKGNIALIDTSEIEKVIFWDAKSSKREWLTSQLVITSASMIQTVKHQQYWTRLKMTGHPEKDSIVFIEDNITGGYDLINYNSRINKKELIRLAEMKLKPIWHDDYSDFIIQKYNLNKSQFDSHNLWSETFYMCRQKHFQEICDWFAQRKILIVSTWETC